MKATLCTDERIPTYNRRQLTLARDLLDGEVRNSTQVSLFGLTIRRSAPGSAWAVLDDDDNTVDYLNIDGTTSATALLSHLRNLRQSLETQAGTTRVGP